MVIRRAKCIRGEIVLPGDKSISHRAAIIAAMAEGESRIENFATSADCAATLKCLGHLGVGIRREGGTVWVNGVGKSGFTRPLQSLDCGNSGTTMRLLAGVLAGQGFVSVLTGDESLRRRPMRRVIQPLSAMGAFFESNEGRAPLTVHGKHRLRGAEYRLPVASAQIKSCILLAGFNAEGETAVVEPIATRDHTERMLRWYGADVNRRPAAQGQRLSVNGNATLAAKPVTVPADISAAAFFMIAASCLPGSNILMKDVGLNPTRSALIHVLKSLGANLNVANVRELNNEPAGDIRAEGVLQYQAVNELKGGAVAGLIDEIPILAVFATQLDLGLEIRDAGELRVKESDRIAAVVQNLTLMGAEVEEYDDGFRVRKSNLKGTRVDSFGDHRIAMAFAIAGLLADEGETEIVGADCVDVSFPGFFEALQNAVVYK